MADKKKYKCKSKQPAYVSEYFKGWYEKNREKHLANVGQKVKCECGKKCRKDGLRRHRRSKVHKRLMENVLKK